MSRIKAGMWYLSMWIMDRWYIRWIIGVAIVAALLIGSK